MPLWGSHFLPSKGILLNGGIKINFRKIIKNSKKLLFILETGVLQVDKVAGR